MLTIRSLNVAYGGLRALSDVSLDVEHGQFVAVVGPNGAGKSARFPARSRLSRARSFYNGRNLLALPAAERAHFGIAHVPEGRQVFASMSVMENLEMGAYTRNGRIRRAEILPTIFELFPVLAERRNQLAGTLSGGEQQMLAIGRGLASAPDLLMLDEPSMGLAPAVVEVDLRAHLSDPSGSRTHHPASRAACGRSAQILRPWIRAGNWTHRSARAPRRDRVRCTRAASLSRHLTDNSIKSIEPPPMTAGA